MDTVKDSPTAQVLGLVLDQPCTLTPREGRRLSGAYLRSPVVAPLGFELLFVQGREGKTGLPRSFVIDGSAVRRLSDGVDDTLTGSRRSRVTLVSGFAPKDSLPNVYTTAYRTDKIDYTGSAVVGASVAGFEIPTSGAQIFSGRIEVTLTAQSDDGTPTSQRAIGTFELAAGYGAKRAQFTAKDLGGSLPFDTLSWSNLYQCGTRLLSSGEGRVTIKSGTDVPTVPFQTGRDPVALNAIFESSLFAPEERPALPEKAGGIFIVQSDVGTITGVFLSDAVGG